MPNQYQHEDEPNLDMLLAEQASQGGQMVVYGEQADALVQTINDRLGWLWQTTNDAERRAQLVAVSQEVARLREFIASMTTISEGSTTAAALAAKQRNNALEELAVIEEALSEGWAKTPLMKDFARLVEADYRLNYGRELYRNALDRAVVDVWDQVAVAMMRVVPGASKGAINDLLDTIHDPQGQLSSMQQGLLKALIATFEAARQETAV